MTEEIAYRYWLSNIEGIGSKTVRHLIHITGSAEAIYQLNEVQLDSLLPGPLAGRILKNRMSWDVAGRYEQLVSGGTRFFTPDTPGYPVRLLQIPDRPEGLYVIGRLPDDYLPYVAVIGARECSDYGRRAAEYFARTLSAAGVGIISGMARGIDCIAQEAALQSGGDSFAVLGCGINICYPESSRRLYETLKESGGIISEYPPGTAPKAGLFPVRNRIISGLADLILVVEAREKSGTLITVDMALEQGREVFAVPGRISDGLSIGCNVLIRQGAGIAVSAADVLQELQKLQATFQKRPPDQNDSDKQGRKAAKQGDGEAIREIKGEITATDERNTDETECVKRNILHILSDGPFTRQQIYDRLLEKRNIQAAELTQELMELCIGNKVENRGGYYYQCCK